MRMFRLFVVVYWATALLLSYSANAQGVGKKMQDPLEVVRFDKTLHDFGCILEDDPPVSCTFTFTNTGTKPVAIYNVISSCGCTTAGWTKKPVPPGGKGEVTATYLNDQGPYPFDKSLTLYTSVSRKPIILHITGTVYPKNKSLREAYPVAFGPLGIQYRYGIDAGQIDMGNTREGTATVANTSAGEVRVTFSAKSPGLKLSITPNPIPAKTIAILSYSISTEGERKWGNIDYSAKVACNGVICKEPLRFRALVLDNFSNMTSEQMNSAPLVLEERTTAEAGSVKRGEPLTVSFPMQNIGKDPLRIRKIESSEGCVAIDYPKELKGGAKGAVKATVQTGALAKGSNVITLTVITNSPNRALMNLYIHFEVL